jgi:hypothetical protein
MAARFRASLGAGALASAGGFLEIRTFSCEGLLHGIEAEARERSPRVELGLRKQLPSAPAIPHREKWA